MVMNEELEVSIDQVLQGVTETNEFKTMLKKLIENYLRDNYTEDEILAVIDLIKVETEEGG